MAPDSTIAPQDGTRAATSRQPVRVQGKFFFVGEEKYFVKGVTYGPFALGSAWQRNFPSARSSSAISR